MSTTLWVQLVVAAIGLLGPIVGTVAGVLITQRRSDRRKAAAWERERARERELWARDDVLRNFEAPPDVTACHGDDHCPTVDVRRGWTDRDAQRA